MPTRHRRPGSSVVGNATMENCRICKEQIESGGHKGLGLCAREYQRWRRFKKDHGREPTDAELSADPERRNLVLFNWKPKISEEAAATLKAKAAELGVSEYMLGCTWLEERAEQVRKADERRGKR